MAIERLRKDDGRALILYSSVTTRRGAVLVSELRFNELRGEQVAYAIHRQDRTFLPTREHCPLCPTKPGGAADRDPARGV